MATAAQLTPSVDDVSTFYLSQGVLGVTCVVLMAVIAKLWHSREKDRIDHKAEVAAKDSLIQQIQNERLAEAVSANKAVAAAQANVTLEAFAHLIKKGRS